MANYTVKSGSVTIEVKPWTHPSGRSYWRATYHCPITHKRRSVTRAVLADAKEAAFNAAKSIATGTFNLNDLAPNVVSALRRLLEVDPQLALVDEFLTWRSKAKPEKPCPEAVDEFIAIKKANQGNSTQNVKTLKKHLEPIALRFADCSLASITVSQIESHLSANPKHSNRTRRNVRASLVTFFRWCRSMGYLPEGETAAEKTSTPIVADSIPETYQPEQLRTLLDNVNPEFLPWLATAAFAGVRTDEISPIPGSKKSPLDWSDFKWERDLIIIRPETAKTKRRRVVPILPALRSWLYEIKRDSGPIHQTHAPTKRGKGKDAQAETVRLGTLIGGWKSNAIRHSFISYRAAIVSLGQTAMEAGNSEAEAKASYNDAKGADEAEVWFSLLKTR
jgi:integrase